MLWGRGWRPISGSYHSSWTHSLGSKSQLRCLFSLSSSFNSSVSCSTEEKKPSYFTWTFQKAERQQHYSHGVWCPHRWAQYCTASEGPGTEEDLLISHWCLEKWASLVVALVLTFLVSSSAGSGVGVFTEGGTMGDFTASCWGCCGHGIPKAIRG